MFTPVHRYEKLHPAAHRLARVPRYARLLSQLSESQLQSIDTEAKLFWKVYTDVGDAPEQHTGILHDALRRPDNQSFGWHSKEEPSFEATDYLVVGRSCCRRSLIKFIPMLPEMPMASIYRLRANECPITEVDCFPLQVRSNAAIDDNGNSVGLPDPVASIR